MYYKRATILDMSNTTICPKCTGTGKTNHLHIENGRCFQCDGTGRVERRANRRAVKISPVQAVDCVRARFCALRSMINRDGLELALAIFTEEHDDRPSSIEYVRGYLPEIDAETQKKIISAFATLGVAI